MNGYELRQTNQTAVQWNTGSDKMITKKLTKDEQIADAREAATNETHITPFVLSKFDANFVVGFEKITKEILSMGMLPKYRNVKR